LFPLNSVSFSQSGQRETRLGVRPDVCPVATSAGTQDN